MEWEACVCDHGYERSDLCAEIIIIIIIIRSGKRVAQQIMSITFCFTVLSVRSMFFCISYYIIQCRFVH